MRRVIALAAFTATLGLAPTAAAIPALPPGVAMQDVIGGPIAVPAGQTTTVDLGVPVSVSYHSGGWSITSAGTAVSVTAPAEGGSAAVPVSAAGYSTTLTLVAEGTPATAVPPADVPDSPATPATPPAEAPADPAGPAAPATDAAVPVSPVDRRNAEHIPLESTVEGNRVTATLGMVQALKLFNQFRDVSQEGLNLRYLDAEGKPISGVTREIDEVSRTLTLTYPEGQSPDNPFIMEIARDGAAVAVVTLTDPRVPAAPGAEVVDMTAASADEAEDRTGLLVLAGVLGLVFIVGGISLIARRRRTRA